MNKSTEDFTIHNILQIDFRTNVFVTGTQQHTVAYVN